MCGHAAPVAPAAQAPPLAVRTTSLFQVLFQLQGEKIGVCLTLQFPGAEVVGQMRSRSWSGPGILKNRGFGARGERVRAPGPGDSEQRPLRFGPRSSRGEPRGLGDPSPTHPAERRGFPLGGLQSPAAGWRARLGPPIAFLKKCFVLSRLENQTNMVHLPPHKIRQQI